MTFASTFARALVPAAIAVAALAGPAVASNATDLARSKPTSATTQSMAADFTQTDGKGRQLSGTLSLKRPGRIRFEYGRGANMLLVGNGKTLSFVDYEVGQKSSWPVAKSPLAVLLSAKPDLGRIARIVPSNDPRVVVVRARDARRPEFGTLVLAFMQGAGRAGRAAARRLDRDRRPEQEDQGPPRRPALQCRGARKRLHLRRTEARNDQNFVPNRNALSVATGLWRL